MKAKHGCKSHTVPMQETCVTPNEYNCRNSVRKQVWKSNNRERDVGSMDNLGLHGIHAGERERERERERVKH